MELKVHVPLYSLLSRPRQSSFAICEYANDAYEAQKDAIEDVPFLKTHPSYIDYVTNDSGLDYLMGVVPMGR